MSWDDWLPASRGELRNLWSYVLDQTEHITRIGEIAMARMNELATRLNTATNELASDLQALRDQVAQLDEGLAAQFEPMVARLEEMGQDPQNPVPDAPADGGNDGSEQSTGNAGNAGVTDANVPGDGNGNFTVNPTPGAADNPNNA